MRRRNFLVCGIAAGIAGSAAARSEGPVRFGQMLVTGFRGTRIGDPEVDVVRRYLSEGTVAGVLLLGRNIVSPEQLTALTSALRNETRGLTPIIAIDQEGGRVSRLHAANGFFDWMSAAKLAALGMTDDDVVAYYAKRAREMSAAGINLNFAPVVDINVNPINPIIGRLGRSYGRSVAMVTRHAALFISAHRSAGVLTSLKHFPGHGSSVTDSHRDVANVSDSWQPYEAQPFRDLVARGLADTIMAGHLLHPRFSDWNDSPTSLSRRTVENIRGVIGFEGPVITDDMQMGAITRHMSLADAAIAAVNAGNSMLIYSNYRKRDRVETAKKVETALRNAGPIVNGSAAAKEVQLVAALRSRLN